MHRENGLRGVEGLRPSRLLAAGDAPQKSPSIASGPRTSGRGVRTQLARGTDRFGVTRLSYGSHVLRITLTFSRIECSRCGAERQTRLPCPDCGMRPRPTEVDINLQFRRNAVKAAQSARKAEALPIAVDAKELLSFERIGTLAERIFSAGDLIGRREEKGATRLASLAAEIGSLERWTREVERLRPWVFLTDAVKMAVEELVKVYDIVVQALICDEIRAAQTCQVEAQAALDRSADAISDADRGLELMLRVLEGGDPIGTWMAVAIDGDPATAIERGKALFLRRTGMTCGDSAAFMALMLAPMTATVCDEDRWWDLVNEHIRFLDDHRADLGPVLQDPSYASRRSDVTHDLWQSARRAARMPDPETMRQEAADLLEVGHLVVEQQLKFNLGLGCALTTRRSFTATQGQDVAVLAGIARDQNWPIAQNLEDAAIRNAFAHRDFTIDSDSILLTPQRGGKKHPARSLTMSQLLDSVLEIIEIAAAMELATLWITENIDPTSVYIPKGIEFMEALLTGFGFDEVEATRNTDDCVRTSACIDSSVPLATIVSAVQPLVGTAREASFHLTRRDQAQECIVVVPVDIHSVWQRAATVLDREVAFLRLCNTTMVDGMPAMSRDHVRHVISIRASQLFLDQDQPLADVCAGLTTWRSLADTLSFADLAKDIRRAIKCRRYRAVGLQIFEADVPMLLDHSEEDLPPPITDLLS